MITNDLNEIYERYGTMMSRNLDARLVRFAVTTGYYLRLIDSRMSIRFDQDAHSAYYSGTTNEPIAMMPGAYFDEGLYEQLGIAEAYHAAAALALINGSQIHEALHSYITRDQGAIASLVKSRVLAPAAISIFQVVEDVFIEAWLANNDTHSLMGMIDLKNRLLFERCVQERVEKIDASDPMSFANALVCYKWRESRCNPNWNKFPKAAKLLQKIEQAGKSHAPDDSTPLPNKRARWANQLYEAIFGEDPFKQPDTDPSTSALMGDDELKSAGVDVSSIEPDEHMTAIANEAAKGEESRQLASHLTKHAPDIPNVIEVGVHKVKEKPNDAFKQLGQVIYTTRAPHRNTGQPTDRGGKLHASSIHRIATDGKVLRRRTSGGRSRKQLAEQVPHIVLLVDLSGSMCHESVGSERLVDYALKVTLGAHLALMKARVPVVTYGHTSSDCYGPNLGGWASPGIYKIAANGMPFNGRVLNDQHVERRFREARAIKNASNYDGEVISWLRRHAFAPRCSSPTIIVLSDGEPCGGNQFLSAIERTAAEANLCRSQGIKVFSMSLIDQVIKSNDLIYGEEFNFSAVGHQLETELSRLILALSS